MLWLELAASCNLTCAFCYNPWRSADKSAYPVVMNAAEWEATLEPLLDTVTFRLVVLSGGEPLLFRELPRLVAWLRGRNQRTTLTTNGVLLSEERLEELRDAGLEGVQVSLLGSTAETHDRLAGRRSFWRALEGLARARVSGCFTTVTFVATNGNIGEMGRLTELIGLLGIDQLIVNQLQPVGSARQALSEIGVTGLAFDAALDDAMARGARLGVKVIPVRLGGDWGRGARAWRKWSVSPSGDLKLCNHSTRKLGALREIERSALVDADSALSEGRLEAFRGMVDSCPCFEQAVAGMRGASSQPAQLTGPRSAGRLRLPGGSGNRDAGP